MSHRDTIGRNAWVAAVLLAASGCTVVGHLRDSASDSGLADTGSSALDQRIAAAEATAASDPLCTAITPFYWEIGDASGKIAGGTEGGTRFQRDTAIEIASASKLVFGAYVVQRFQDDLGSVDFKAMTMRSGYVSFENGSCAAASTVQGCFDAGSNGTYTASDDGKFDYGGGHFQKYAVDLGLGPDDDAALAAEYQRVLGADIPFAFKYPQPAGGMRVSAATYAQFLQKILSGQLAIYDHLGDDAVCTLPSACPDAAVYSPAAPEDWHYSYGHWVEDDPTNGDGAFSSAGKLGFYPWIDATRTTYGLVSRWSLASGAAMQSAECGIDIRHAFATGVAL